MTNTCFFQNIEQVKRIPERSFKKDMIKFLLFEVFKSSNKFIEACICPDLVHL